MHRIYPLRYFISVERAIPRECLRHIFIQERTKLANDLKAKGNKAYGDRKFEDAVKFYTRAIEIAPKPEPVFYSNRAASAY